MLGHPHQGHDVARADHWGAQALAWLAAYCQDPSLPCELPLRPAGTAFQRRVWRALRGIPCGSTRTYGELAHELGSAAQAVGNACRRNPIAILVPCHRVCSASGLGGYAGATTGFWPELKQRLLQHEGAR